MASLSDETKLINMCIALSEGASDWPTYLEDAGYELENILPSFRNSDGERVEPNLIFVSHDRVLVVECEAGELSEDIVERLSEIETDNLRTEFERVSDSVNYDHEVFYFGSDNIERYLSELDISDPVLVYDSQTGRLSKRNNFDDGRLDSLVRDTTVGNRVPVQFFHFSPDDSAEIIAEKVFQKLCSKAVKKQSDGQNISPRELSKEVFSPEYWQHISNPARQEIIKRVEYILSEFEERNADEDMRKLKKSGRRYYVRTSDAFMRKCQEIIDDLSEDGFQDDLSSYT